MCSLVKQEFLLHTPPYDPKHAPAHHILGHTLHLQPTATPCTINLCFPLSYYQITAIYLRSRAMTETTVSVVFKFNTLLCSVGLSMLRWRVCKVSKMLPLHKPCSDMLSDANDNKSKAAFQQQC